MGVGRQAKLTGGKTDSGTSLKETQPSPFAEMVAPVIPEFSAEGKKPTGRGRGKVKSEPKAEDVDGTSATTIDDPKQKMLKFEVKDEQQGDLKKPPASKPSKSGAGQAKKRKVKEMLDSFTISSDSDGEGEEEVEIEKKSLRERIELRKAKPTNYKQETVFSGDESIASVESEGSWKSGSESVVDTPPIKKAKTASGAGKGPIEISEVTSKPPTDKAKPGKDKKKVVVPPAAKKAPARKGASSSGSSGEKKRKMLLGKKSRVVACVSSDDESDNIQSASDSDSFTLPAKKRVATEVHIDIVHVTHKHLSPHIMLSYFSMMQTVKSRPQRGKRVQYNLISDDSDDSDFMA